MVNQIGGLLTTRDLIVAALRLRRRWTGAIAAIPDQHVEHEVPESHHR